MASVVAGARHRRVLPRRGDTPPFPFPGGFKKGTQADYRLFQVADLLCTMELLLLKTEQKILTNSELLFFKSAKELNKSYLRAIQKKRFHLIE